ncbi:TetR/AcrR family transcriptional regulator [Ohtaekwangia kribbensis]|jgi:AcrR family transcriptional regulator|uniref:TetR/AcrR family transcriptional regulator n=1 Tax=Ohtaekwangia kribbensis TaxID=688913 RepID=A0ABW3K584_9BACT
MPKKKTVEPDITTEEKIKEAARKVFLQKGYAATRTRDIAEEAGLNLALLNYYFRSKEKLFEIVMMEKVQKLFGVLAPILNDNSTSLEKKIELAATNHIGMLMENPDLPLFVMSEIRNNPERFAGKIQAVKLIQESHFVKQLKEKRPDINPLHFVISLLGMVLFPFIAKPVLQEAGSLSVKGFQSMMEERKALVPIWMKALLKTR